MKTETIMLIAPSNFWKNCFYETIFQNFVEINLQKKFALLTFKYNRF